MPSRGSNVHRDGADHPDEAGAATGLSRPYLRLTLDSSMLSVRAALAELRGRLAELSLHIEVAGAVELVLAEVLNNICEHAYRDHPGRIDLSVWIEGDTMAFEIEDHGAPMPSERLPMGRLPSHRRPVDELPEGGFGWSLIRQLASDLAYSRTDGRNRLTFRMRRGSRAAGRDCPRKAPIRP